MQKKKNSKNIVKIKFRFFFRRNNVNGKIAQKVFRKSSVPFEANTIKIRAKNTNEPKRWHRCGYFIFKLSYLNHIETMPKLS